MENDFMGYEMPSIGLTKCMSSLYTYYSHINYSHKDVPNQDDFIFKAKLFCFFFVKILRDY